MEVKDELLEDLMEVKDELAKDLEAMSHPLIFTVNPKDCQWNSDYKAFVVLTFPLMLREQVVEYLTELGYRKVVECGKCKYEKHCDMYIHNKATGWATEVKYCSEGIPKEGVND